MTVKMQSFFGNVKFQSFGGGKFEARGGGESIVWGMTIFPLFGFPEHEVNDVGQMNSAQDDLKKIGLNEGFNRQEVFAFQEYQGELYCCGDFSFKDGGAFPRPFTFLAKYNENSGVWEGLTALSFPQPSITFDLSNSAKSMTVWNNILVIAGGAFNRAGNSGDTNSNNLVGWDGSNFVDLGATLAFGPVSNTDQVIVFQENLTACGSLNNFSPFKVYPVKVWDGNNWNAASPSEPDIGRATAMAIYKNELYFALDTGTIRKWTGSGTFITVATVTGEVRTMEVHGGNLCIGGTVTLVDGVVVRNVAKFNGTDWSEIGTGLKATGANEGAFDLLSAGSFLFVVGEFIGNNDGDNFMGLAKIGSSGDWVKTWDDTNMDNNLIGHSLGKFKGKLDI